MLDVYWYLIGNDGRLPQSPGGRRVVDYAYLQQQARALDHLGYTGALLAINPGSRDQWVSAAALLPYTERLKFLIAVYAGVTSPLQLASQAATLDQFSKGRVEINVVSGDTRGFPSNGIFLDHDQQYEQSAEYWHVWRRLMQGENVTFEGKYVRLANAQLNFKPYQTPHPPLFLGGSSDQALQLAAEQVSTYLTWGEPPEQAGAKIARVRELAAAKGRKLRYGVRLQLIVRDTKDEAWDWAQRILDQADPAQVELVRKVRAGSDSVGVQRMNALLGDGVPKHARDLEVYPDVWAGYALFGKGPGTAIVGDPDTVAARLQEYLDVGFDTLVLSSFPLLEESYRVAEDVLPRLHGFKGGRQAASDDMAGSLRRLVAAS